MMNTENTTKGYSLIGRRGLLKADPTGAQVVWRLKDRTFLADVTGFYHNDTRGGWILKVRHFNGESAGEVALAAVELLNRR